jgi:hypothetical protein
MSAATDEATLRSANPAPTRWGLLRCATEKVKGRRGFFFGWP